MVFGDITGIFFDIHAYYIVDGVDNDFHKEGWECSIPEEDAIFFYVSKPEDGKDHYQMTGQKGGYKTRTVDFYVSSEDEYVGVHVILFPIIKSRTTDISFFQIFSSLIKNIRSK
jgi:hypothetical protein